MAWLFAHLQYFIPQRLLTEIVGRLASSRISWLKNGLIKLSIRVFNIDMQEATEPSSEAYPTFNHFFTRTLKTDARVIDPNNSTLISPVDGTVSAVGRLDANRLVQAKDHQYALTSLLAKTTGLSDDLTGGQFITLYLSPRDYHRVHWPLTSTPRATRYVPGELFSVNQATVRHVPNLFARNERLIVECDSEIGSYCLIMVGAMIVAGISTVWHPQIYRAGGVIEDIISEPDACNRGDELGQFTMGSTVIMVFPDGAVEWLPAVQSGSKVRMGQPIANLMPQVLES